jgi:hypothetical protein
MSNPHRQYDALVKAAQDAQRLLAPSQYFAEQIAKSSAFLTVHRPGMAEAIMEMQRRHELLESGQGMQRLLDQITASQDLANQLSSNYHKSLASIATQTSRWQTIVEPAIRLMKDLDASSKRFAGMADSFVAWESSTARLAQRFGSIGLLSRNSALAERLLAPTRVFSDFAQSTLSQLHQTDDPRRSLALETSLRLAEEQLLSTTHSLNDFVVVPNDDQDVSEVQGLDSLYVQQEELLEASTENIDEVDTLRSSAATNAIDLSRGVLTSIATCNEARKIANAEEIFKPTTRLLEVYADLPWVMATNKESFARFVDCLYFLFYEGAGKDNLRYLKAHGGPIEDDDFEFVLCIKHLRNKWTRHDADHGKDSAIRKSWADLSEKFRWLGLDHFPVTREDFRLLHLNLLIMATEFTNKILRGTTGQ